MAAFSSEEQQRIRDTIATAEKETSGEIRICMENSCSEDVLDRAATYFRKLGMDKTAQRNGVLIYLATKDRKFAIIGDAGINQVVPENFWDSTKEAMLGYFKTDQLAEGIITGIRLAGEQLATYFPCLDGDKNELSDEIDYEDGE
jgi:uncharacterized membrane protein